MSFSVSCNFKLCPANSATSWNSSSSSLKFTCVWCGSSSFVGHGHHNGFYQVSLCMQVCLHPVTSDQRYEWIRSYCRRDRQPPKMKRLRLEAEDSVGMGGPELHPVSWQTAVQTSQDLRSTKYSQKGEGIQVFIGLFEIILLFAGLSDYQVRVTLRSCSAKPSCTSIHHTPVPREAKLEESRCLKAHCSGGAADKIHSLSISLTWYKGPSTQRISKTSNNAVKQNQM